MSLTDQDVNHVARLARLALTDDERTRSRDQLGRILEYIRALEKWDTRQVAPTSHVLPLANVWREDAVRRFKDTEAILANAPEREDCFFKVAKVME